MHNIYKNMHNSFGFCIIFINFAREIYKQKTKE